MKRLTLDRVPDRLLALVPGLHALNSAILANEAIDAARHSMPRVTGHTAQRLTPESGPGFFGISWGDPYVWYMEQGTRPFLMRNLAGKTIPMWINDPTGKLAKDNPKARTRMTADGRVQTLIFRRAANQGDRKMAWRTVNGTQRRVNVPRSYPGAPGRIRAVEIERIPSAGIVPGRIATGNVGVRWRHPGLSPAHYMENSIRRAALMAGIEEVKVLPYYGDMPRLDAAA